MIGRSSSPSSCRLPCIATSSPMPRSLRGRTDRRSNRRNSSRRCWRGSCRRIEPLYAHDEKVKTQADRAAVARPLTSFPLSQVRRKQPCAPVIALGCKLSCSQPDPFLRERAWDDNCIRSQPSAAASYARCPHSHFHKLDRLSCDGIPTAFREIVAGGGQFSWHIGSNRA